MPLLVGLPMVRRGNVRLLQTKLVPGGHSSSIMYTLCTIFFKFIFNIKFNSYQQRVSALKQALPIIGNFLTHNVIQELLDLIHIVQEGRATDLGPAKADL